MYDDRKLSIVSSATERSEGVEVRNAVGASAISNSMSSIAASAFSSDWSEANKCADGEALLVPTAPGKDHKPTGNSLQDSETSVELTWSLYIFLSLIATDMGIISSELSVDATPSAPTEPGLTPLRLTPAVFKSTQRKGNAGKTSLGDNPTDRFE
jgi:hypothetical protein